MIYRVRVLGLKPGDSYGISSRNGCVSLCPIVAQYLDPVSAIIAQMNQRGSQVLLLRSVPQEQ